MKACHNCMHWPVCNMREDDNACGYYKPQEKMRVKPITNADRIRAMSDEEMLDLFRYRGCPPDRLTGKCVKVGVCEACWADWLKQPAEEESEDDLSILQQQSDHLL